MSIEQQLQDEFQQNAKNVVCPPSIDRQVMSAYREHVMEKKGEQPMRTRRKWSKAAVVILLIAVVSGFAYAGRTLLFEETKGNMTLSAETLEELKLSRTQLKSIRQARNEVKSQLNPGESAAIYLTDLDNIKSLPFVVVSQPEVNEDLDSWRDLIASQNITDPLPDELLGTYRFAGGMEQSPFGMFVGSESDMEALQQEMKAESEATGKDMVWRITSSSSTMPLLSYTTTYRNAEQETLYLVMETAPDSRSMKLQTLAPSSAKYEEMDLNGHSAHYYKNDSYIYTDSHYYQEISWFIENDGQTIIYRLGSDSSAMTKEQLMEAARSL